MVLTDLHCCIFQPHPPTILHTSSGDKTMSGVRWQDHVRCQVSSDRWQVSGDKTMSVVRWPFQVSGGSWLVSGDHIRWQITCVRWQDNARCQMAGVWWQVLYVMWQEYVLCQVSDVRWRDRVRLQVSGDRCLKSGDRWHMSGDRCHMSGDRCQKTISCKQVNYKVRTV